MMERAEHVEASTPDVHGASGAFAPEALASPLAAQAADASVRISRRTPIAVPGFGAPPAPSESQMAALDDYFDRLDAAFSTLQQAPASPAGTAPAPPAPAGGASDDVPSAAASEPAAGQSVPESAGQAASPVAAAPTPAPKAPAQVPGIAQAFSALFAAERGETAAEIPSFIGPAVMPQASVDDLVERVSRQVLERMSDRVVRDTVTDIVSQVAERLVRDEIERVKATLK